MPCKCVTVSERRPRDLEDFQLNYYSVSELAECFGISITTASLGINRFKQHGQAGFGELSLDRPSITFLLSKDKP